MKHLISHKIIYYLSIFLAFILLNITVVIAEVNSHSQTNSQALLAKFNLTNNITALNFCSTGKFLVYGSDDGKIRFWNMQSGELLHILAGHTAFITDLAFNFDNKILVSSSEDKTIRFWDTQTGQTLKILNLDYVATAIAINHQTLATTANGGKVSLWNMETGKLMRKPFNWTSRYIKAIVFSPNGEFLAVGSSDLKVRLWKTDTFKLQHPRLQYTRYQYPVSLDFNLNNNLLATGFTNGMVYLWDLATKKLVTKLYKHRVAADSIVNFSADGKILAYTLYNQIYLWNSETGKSSELLTTDYSQPIQTIKFNPNLQYNYILAYVPKNGTVQLWDTKLNILFGFFTANNSDEWLSCLQENCLCSGKTCFQEPTISTTTKIDAEIEKTPAKPLKSSAKPIISTTTKIDAEIEKISAEPLKSLAKPIISTTTKIDAEIEKTPAEPLKSLAKPIIQETTPLLTESSSQLIPPSNKQDNSPIETNKFTNIFYTLIAILFFSLLLLYRHFICKYNADLLATTLPKLAKKYKLLKRYHCLNKILANKSIQLSQLQDAIQFAKTTSELKQMEILANYFEVENWQQMDTHLFKVFLSERFPLNLSFLAIYFSPFNQTVENIFNNLNQQQNIQKVLIIHFDPNQQLALQQRIKNEGLMWLVPTNIELSRWLLSSQPNVAFAKILSTHLGVNQLSPYQMQGGLNKDAVFFGRKTILAYIFSRKLSNYLVIGGRQLGKSSLLKYIYRHYQNHSQVQCFYISLYDDNIVGQIAIALNLTNHDSLTAVLEQLVKMAAEKPLFLLIDQVDYFIQTEIKTNYPILNRLRSLSEQGHCYFILAGFWNLYQASKLYDSPLNNFSKPIIISELEADACYELAVNPMQIMNLRYESNTLVNNLITETGQRPSLIALICNELIKNLSKQQHVFKQADMDKVLNSDALREALKSWHITSIDNENYQLDRIIMYATVKDNKFTTTKLHYSLNQLNCHFNIDEIKQAVERLKLSFIIKQGTSGDFVYAVPLFRKWLLKENVDELLSWELKS